MNGKSFLSSIKNLIYSVWFSANCMTIILDQCMQNSYCALALVPKYSFTESTRTRLSEARSWTKLKLFARRNLLDNHHARELGSREDEEETERQLGLLPLETRRGFLWSVSAAVLVSQLPSSPSRAVGLEQFPQTSSFANCYHFMRVGTTLLEEDDIWSTNPLFLTNRDDALSPTGEDQITASCQQLKKADLSPTVVRHSLAAACVDTARIIARELGLGRDRVVAEYTFLDPRAIGQWDMLSKKEVMPAVWAMDDMEAGVDGTEARPPPNEDGTPHETLSDQTIRLRQLFSLLETQYSGDTILLIFPDGTGPAVLSAMIAGIPLNRVHELEFEPGELRLNVTIDSVQDLWQSKIVRNYADYQRILKEGRDNLAKLRTTKTFVNRKDARIEAERLAIDEQYNLEQTRKRQAAEAKLERERKDQEEARLERERKSRVRQEDLQFMTADDETLRTGTIAGASFLAIVGATQLGKSGDDKDLKDPNNDSEAAGAPLAAENASPTLSSYFGESSSISSLNATQNDSNVTTVIPQPANGDLRGTLEQIAALPPVAEPVDRYAAAQKAMEEYLNEDDGGAAWLFSLSELMEDNADSSSNDQNPSC